MILWTPIDHQQILPVHKFFKAVAGNPMGRFCRFIKIFHMKYFTITICMALLLTGMTAIAQKTDKKKDDAKFASSKETNKEKWKVVDSATAMKNWMEYMTPGKAHEMLSKADGEWTGEMTMWMAPGAPPTKSITTATNTMVMGGRYQLS